MEALKGYTISHQLVSRFFRVFIVQHNHTAGVPFALNLSQKYQFYFQNKCYTYITKGHELVKKCLF